VSLRAWDRAGLPGQGAGRRGGVGELLGLELAVEQADVGGRELLQHLVLGRRHCLSPGHAGRRWGARVPGDDRDHDADESEDHRETEVPRPSGWRTWKEPLASS
jgi:hypothetical protein